MSKIFYPIKYIIKKTGQGLMTVLVWSAISLEAMEYQLRKR